MKIIIKGKSSVRCSDRNGNNIPCPLFKARIVDLANRAIDKKEDDFVYYMHENMEFIKNKLKEGYPSFILEGEDIITVTTYIPKEDCEFTGDELKKLMKYTQGQWSDGWGEGFEQSPIYESEEGDEVYVSPWYHGQKLRIEILGDLP